MYMLIYLNFQVKETLETGLKDRQTFGTPLEIITKKIHVLNYTGHPQKSPTINVVLHRCWTRILQLKYKNNTPVTGTGGTRTKRSATTSLKFQWIEPRIGLAEPT